MKLIGLANAGSSSFKFSLVTWPGKKQLAQVEVERIGQRDSILKVQAGRSSLEILPVRNHLTAVGAVLRVLKAQGWPLDQLTTVVHRIVFGGDYTGAVLITPRVERRLTRFSKHAPLHNPPALEALAAWRRAFPRIRQVACFDTSFFSGLPEVASTYAIRGELRRAYDLRRYGFHGLSHAAAARQAARLLGRSARRLNLITIHLGSGCSAAAIQAGRPVDTSMGSTPLEGLVMGTRPGDLDPGIVLELGRQGWTTAELDHEFNYRSGLLGLSGYSADLRDILIAAGYRVRGYTPARAATVGQRRAARLALNVFCYRVRKYIGAYAAVLGRVDAVVVTGAAGERNADLRRRILAPLPIGLRRRVIVVPTDENGEMMRTASRFFA